MPYRWETFSVEPEGGLVENLSPLKLGVSMPGAATRLVNFEPSINGGYRRINGYSKYDSNEVTGTGQVFGVAYFDSNVIAVRNGNIYKSTGGGWTSIATGRTHTTKHRFHIINLNGTQKLIGADGSNYPYSWDSTTFTNINGTTDINGTDHVAAFKDHVFYAAGNLVTFSVPFDETDFTVADGAGSFNVHDDVTGMIVFRQRLYIFTKTSIHVLDGSSQSDFALTSISEDIGCVAHDTVQEVAGDVAFLSNDGVRLVGATDRIGDFSNLLASTTVQEPFRVFTDTYTHYSSCVIRGKSQYRIFGFTSGNAEENAEGYLGTQFEAQNALSFSWAKLESMEVYAADSQISNGTEIIVFCNEQTGYIYIMDSGNTFDGTEISASYWTPYFSFTDPTMRTTLYKLNSYYDPENDITGMVTINFDFDKSTKIQPSSVNFSLQGGGVIYGNAVYGTDTYGVDLANAILETNIIGSGNTAQFRFEFSGSAPFIIDSMLIEHATEDRN